MRARGGDIDWCVFPMPPAVVYIIIYVLNLEAWVPGIRLGSSGSGQTYTLELCVHTILNLVYCIDFSMAGVGIKANRLA